jgi:tyrosyl-tRNA synthetase
MLDFVQELTWRGFIHSATHGAADFLRIGKVTGYIGFDPTAKSLHVGSLLPIMGLVHFQRAGHHPIAVAGGGTGLIGDPSGKAQERKLLTTDEIETNLEGIKEQLSRFLDFRSAPNPARLVNNADWLSPLLLMNFLRDVGKHFSINEMMARDSVRSRIEKEQGMSFTEFSYSLLQAYDFLELHDRYGCTLQMGGSDQWGNIVSGTDLIRRLRSSEAHGIVFPLITTSAGVKFGKTEGGTIWLDPSMTSPYRFYQFWFNTDDRDVIQYLKFFTLLPQDRIDELEALTRDKPEQRAAQSTLAEEATRLVHGDTALDQALKASKIFFGGEVRDVGEVELLDIFADVPSSTITRSQLANGGLPVVDLLVSVGAAKSKGEARRAIQGGGIYLNNRRVSGVDHTIMEGDAVHGKFIIVRKGGRSYFLVRLL